MRGEAKKRSDWNYNLLEEVVAPAYAHTLLEISKIFAGRVQSGEKSGETCAAYYSIWPAWKEGVNRDNAWGFLTRKFYDQIGDHPAFTVEHKTGLRFLTLNPPTVVFTPQQRQTYPHLEGLFLDAGVSVTAPPKPIVDTLEKFKKSVNLLLPSFVRKMISKSYTTLAAANPLV
jgi:hypothetical protein